MDDEEQALLYEAGYVAGRLGWSDIDVVSTSEIALVTPSGAPAIVVCGQESLTVDQARVMAALRGAGRRIRLVTTHPLPSEVAEWLPEGAIHVIGRDVATPTATVPIKQATQQRTDFRGALYWDSEGAGGHLEWALGEMGGAPIRCNLLMPCAESQWV